MHVVSGMESKRVFRASALEQQALSKQGQHISECASPLSSSWGGGNLLLHAEKSYVDKLCFGAWFCAKESCSQFSSGIKVREITEDVFITM